MPVQSMPPIEQLSREDKLLLMENLWDSLIRSVRKVPSIEWHKQILADGVRKFESGEQGYLDWEEAKAKMLSQEKGKNS